jgi:Carboxypeptidase regulatory-like domain/TonB dependent receptor-like, beta-barrel
MIAVFVAMLAASPLLQTPRDARVTVTVVDQTGAVIQNATVTATALDAPGTPIPPAQSTDKGMATIGGLAPGRYEIKVEFPGFETRVLKDVRIKSGDNKHVAALSIQGLQDSVTVSRDAREIASDRRATFGTALTREQIAALSDDPDEMAQQLQDMAGGNAVIRVDSFEGGRLPPKTAIKAIHITRDAFAAENHFAGGLFIDIITQPGLGPLRTNINMRLRDGSLSGTPAALPFGTQQAKGPEQFQNYGGGIGGSLIKQKASFSINAQGNTSYDTPYYHYYTPDRVLVEGLAPRRPRDNVYLFGLFDYAITRDQTLRVNYSHEKSTAKNLGVGQWDQLERGYSSEDGGHYLRIQEAGPLGRRFFINTRASLNWSNSQQHSLFESPTVIVLDGFYSGGQQRSQDITSKSLNLQSDLDYVRGMHSVRTGLQINAVRYHSHDAQNYLGTYTFESLAQYNLGRPRSYTIRVGDPNIAYNNVQAGFYVQDDVRVRKNLTLSPGVRYEAQTHLSDYNNFGPRFGITYSPGKSGKLTLRASAGIFYDWLSTNIYEQTLRVDGHRQQELNILNPSYPIPPDPTGGTTEATNRYLLSDGLQMQRNSRVSAGFDRGLTKMIRVNATYAYVRGVNLMRGFNLNAPIDGVRPDPEFANVVEVQGDAASRQHSVNIGASINFNVSSGGSIATSPADLAKVITNVVTSATAQPSATKPPLPPRWNWRRMQLFVNGFFGRNLNNTDGAFGTPATGFIVNDWGPAAFDIRRRFNVNWSSSQLRNFNANLGFNASSAQPYTIKTGIDTNRDLVFNDRPDGIGRNSARGSAQWTMNGFFSYGWSFGKGGTPMPGGVSIRSDGGAITAMQMSPSGTTGRVRLTLNANVQNITNRSNLGGYIGTITSQAFGHPTVVLGTRKIDFGLSLSF